MNKMIHRNILTLMGLSLLLLIGLGTTGGDAPHSYMSAVYLEDSATDQDIEKADFMISDLGMEMVWIKPGVFAMGSPGSDKARKDDERLHDVKLTRGFWMSGHEVTIGQFQKFAEETRHITQSEMAKVLCNSVTGERVAGKTWRNIFDNAAGTQGTREQGGESEHRAEKPVVGVSKRDAYAFCRWLTTREQKAGRLPEAYEFTLPTEAQWEYACRAGSSKRFSFGDNADELYGFGNYADRSSALKNRDETHDDGHKDTALVGSFEPNAWGLFDMHGNVFELCSDTYWKAYQEGETVDPLGPAGVRMAQYVVRGGAWSSPSGYARSAARHAVPSIDTYSDVGFRVVLDRRCSAIVYTLTGRNRDWSVIRKGNTSRVAHRSLESEETAKVIHFPEKKSLGFLQARIPELQTGWVYIPTRASGHLELPQGVDIKLNITEVNVKSDEDLGPLDSLKTDDLQAIEITEKKFGNGALRHIARLNDLREVTVDSRRVRDSGLKFLSDLRNLERLDLGNTKVRGPGLDYLVGCRRLKGLNLNGTKLTNAGLQHLSKYARLEALRLDDTDLGDPRYKGYRQRYSDDFMAALDRRDKQDQISQFYGEIEQLENTRKGMDDGDGYLKPLSDLRELKALDLSHTFVTNTELISLSNLTKLEVLRLEDTAVTAEGLKHLSKLSNLKEIDLRQTGVDDDGLAYLARLSSLEQISAGDMWKTPQESDKEAGLIQRFEGITPITDEGLRHLSTLENLRSLSLGRTMITGEGFSSLSNLKNLTHLHLRESRLHDEGLAALAHLQGLEELDITGNRVTDSGLNQLLGAPNLRRILAVGTLVTEEGARGFMKQREDVEVILEEPIEIES
jgi:formylglycine-generating enzyme required for sulfatase activity